MKQCSEILFLFVIANVNVGWLSLMLTLMTENRRRSWPQALSISDLRQIRA